MMSILTSSLYQASSDIDVYPRPLVDDLKYSSHKLLRSIMSLIENLSLCGMLFCRTTNVLGGHNVFGHLKGKRIALSA
jgi:hypothetical protein